jgi:hypothetical protein
MRKTVLLAAMTAIMALMLAATPAMADDFDREDFCDVFDCNDRFFDDDFDRFDFNGDGFQDFEQDAESGDVDQSFEVTSSGDNSNQSAGIQGVANTGNAQNQIGVVDAGNGFGGNDFFNDEFDELCDDFDGDDFCDFFFDDDNNRFFFGDDDFLDDDDGNFEFDDVGSSIEVSPTNTTSSDQEVNQAATAAR